MVCDRSGVLIENKNLDKTYQQRGYRSDRAMSEHRLKRENKVDRRRDRVAMEGRKAREENQCDFTDFYKRQVDAKHSNDLLKARLRQSSLEDEVMPLRDVPRINKTSKLIAEGQAPIRKRVDEVKSHVRGVKVERARIVDVSYERRVGQYRLPTTHYGNEAVYQRTTAQQAAKEQYLNQIRQAKIAEELAQPFSPAILEMSAKIVGERERRRVIEELAQPKHPPPPPPNPQRSDPKGYLRCGRGGGNSRRAPPPPSYVDPPPAVPVHEKLKSLGPAAGLTRTEMLLATKRASAVIML